MANEEYTILSYRDLTNSSYNELSAKISRLNFSVNFFYDSILCFVNDISKQNRLATLYILIQST